MLKSNVFKSVKAVVPIKVTDDNDDCKIFSTKCSLLFLSL